MNTPGDGVLLAADLARHGARTALRHGPGGRESLSYETLAAQVRQVADALSTDGDRRLVLIAADNTVGSLVHHLAALSVGHVPLLVPSGSEHLQGWLRRWDPDLVVAPEGGRTRLTHRRQHSGHRLHPDLALLLTTSGTTGSPRLVRLSRENVQSNAEAIAETLGVQPDDVAATTLPMAYCYGLSVLHSHLLRGAEVVLTGLSVTDPCFWALAREQRVSTFAGVPYTFELLERVGEQHLDLPHLRYVTQAGGAMPAERVRHWAEVGRRQGWSLVTMYGQTEATARMAVLPPELVEGHAGAVGVTVPGGTLSIEPASDAPGGEDTGGEVGELVYRGPNVMLGYADDPADLGRGRTVTELRTGDLARVGPAGMAVIVGRCSRLAKVGGVRVDLSHLEGTLADEGLRACCVEVDGRVGVLVENAPDLEAVTARVTRACGLPATRVRVRPVAALPRRPHGKPDLPAAAALLGQAAAETGGQPGAGPVDRAAAVVALYARLLGRPDAGPRDSFVELGGDSLSYVEVSLHLERRLGRLPPDWHLRSARELAGATAAPALRSGPSRVATDTVLRAAAVFTVLAAHAGAISLPGGAHLLLLLAGYHTARFHLTPAPARERSRRVLSTLRRIVLPTVAWLGVVTLVAGEYGWRTVLLVYSATGQPRFGPDWRFWFIEAIVVVLMGLALLVRIPVLDRWERRAPFAVALTVLAVGLLPRYHLLATEDGGARLQFTPTLAVWMFALGWAAARASSAGRRLCVTTVGLVALLGYFDDTTRTVWVAVGLCLLVWVRDVPVPRLLVPVLGAVAAASLHIYLVQFQVYPLFQEVSPWSAVLAALVVGVAYRWLWQAATRRVGRVRARTSKAATRQVSGVA